MKIAVVSSTPVPNAFGGMERMLEGLAAALRQRCPTDLVTVPCDERTAEGVLRGYYEFFNLDLSAYDAVISTKAPSYMVNHPVQVLYLSHRLRVFYDRYEPRDAQHARMRRLIHWMDNWAMTADRIPCVYTIGRTVSRRLLKWGGIPSTPMHLPTTFEPLPPQSGEYFLALGRLHEWKRFDLIIKAMRLSHADVPLMIAGSGPEEEKLRRLAAGDPRIHFLGHIDEQRLRELYTRAIATVFPPINEDLGLVTFESFLTGKPVLTTTDAGEPAEIVRDGETGFITAPTPEAMAERLDWMATHHPEMEAMQPACLASTRELSWDHVVDTLLSAIDKTRLARSRDQAMVRAGERGPNGRGSNGRGSSGRIHLLVTDNQIIDPPIGGGRLRIWELYRHLPEEFVTLYLGTHDHPGPTYRDQWLAPNFREIIMPLTMVHFKAHEVWRRLTGGDATIDVTIPLLLGRCSPRYHQLLAEFIPWAHALICAHPWMFPYLPHDSGLPRIYDSQNCEGVVKGSLLRRTLAGHYLARRVEQVEHQAVSGSRLTLACSPADAGEFVRRYGADSGRIVEIPNGVDCERLAPGAQADKPALKTRLGLPAAPLAVFCGSNYEPNVAAAGFIIDQLAPALPEVTFAIVGGVGPMWEKRREDRPLPLNVRLLGFVSADDLALIYQAADFGLNPMTTGSGTNIKMLDYMATGLAIVTTETGARGLDGRDGEHWRQAGLDGFPAAIRDLLRNPLARQTMAARARQRVEQQYDWRIIAGRLAAALHALLEKDRATVTRPDAAA